ncbi:uncharacterized protein LOC121369471 isoform X2 [Gigantopelta aegis]|uniref:uncharacterized protein LOC121369471 isoform X2 n=1 Tax=Gigantopelta aegis TaxID=1735272 RepID=UPI001B88E733|nr:uncharacterized protein LOC121369471 isoform X2 [Gigantopelta aegis]
MSTSPNEVQPEPETSQNMEKPRKRKHSLMKSGGQHNDVEHLKKTRTGMPGDELKNLQMAVLKEELAKIKEERELNQLQKTKLQLQINFIKGHQSPQYIFDLCMEQ